MIKVHKLKTNPYFLLLSHKIEFADKKKIIDEVYRIIRWFDEVLKTTIKSDDIVYGEQYTVNKYLLIVVNPALADIIEELAYTKILATSFFVDSENNIFVDIVYFGLEED